MHCAIGNYETLGIGHPFMDRVAKVDKDFLGDQKLTKGITNYTEDALAVTTSWKAATVKATTSLGGSGLNVIKVMAKFGHRCALSGKKGPGKLGTEVERRMEARKIVPILKTGKKDTGVSNCFVTPDAERTMHTYIGVSAEFSEKDLVEAEFVGVKHVHIERYVVYAGNVLGSVVKLVQKQGAVTSTDLASINVVEDFKEKFEELIPKVTYVFGNGEEMKMLTGADTVKEAAEHFDSHQTIVATVGKDGCWVKWEGEDDAVHYGAPKVDKVIDTTGAGDFFCGGFMSEALQGKEAKKCVETGNLVASYVIQEFGAQIPQNKWATLTDMSAKI